MAVVFPATAIVDDFNRPDGAAGASWVANPDGGARPEFEVVGNQFSPTAIGAWMTYDSVTDGPYDEWYATVPTYVAGSVEVELGMVDLGSNAYDGYAVEYREASTTWRLQRYNNSVSTLIASVTAAASGISMASGVGLGIRRIDNRLSAIVYSGGSWYEVLTVIDPAPLSAGGVGGLYTDNAGNVFDDFGGGDVPADAVDLLIRPRRRRRNRE